MASFMEEIFTKAKANPKKIVLQEGDDERTVEAAVESVKKGIAKIVLIGDPGFITKTIKEKKGDPDKLEIIDKNNYPKLEEYASEYFEMRKHKGITKEEAVGKIKDPLWYGAMMVRKNDVDAFVAGAVYSTADVCRASIQVVGLKEGIKTLSSFFVMIVPDKSFGRNGVLFYADCGVVIDPDDKQLADIAIAAAESYEMLMGEKPKVAMLSCSTKGSASHSRITKVVNALNIVKKKTPGIMIDGELQGDAALIEAVGQKKAPDSKVAGKANVLVFPDLDSGNIAYKLTERLAKAEAYGPILQGTVKPCCDLSRGCKASDIMNVAAINVVRFQFLDK
ncbi:MAG: phosphate acetyltransferase [Candidatus Goldiibacteriota bacterium]